MKINRTALILLVLCLLVMVADSALASTGAQGFEYEDALEKFSQSITGPVAFFIAIIAMAASGFGIVFGGELTGLIKIACGIICMVGFIVFSANIFQGLFGVSGALIV